MVGSLSRGMTSHFKSFKNTPFFDQLQSDWFLLFIQSMNETNLHKFPEKGLILICKICQNLGKSHGAKKNLFFIYCKNKAK